MKSLLKPLTWVILAFAGGSILFVGLSVAFLPVSPPPSMAESRIAPYDGDVSVAQPSTEGNFFSTSSEDHALTKEMLDGRVFYHAQYGPAYEFLQDGTVIGGGSEITGRWKWLGYKDGRAVIKWTEEDRPNEYTELYFTAMDASRYRVQACDFIMTQGRVSSRMRKDRDFILTLR